MNLRSIRLQKGMTQQMVADYLNYTVVAYSRYETGERMPSIDTLVSIADCFQVTLDYLVGRDADTATGLSHYEAALVNAARQADDRARDDALQLLKLHSTRK